ncbi:uncharacterized protein [Macrobrachium rosenbergii]|uniref:uncharacterized protein n=1 Tax=Macrobrachium rosenbergii TaxID=79674 RepID=UPI0034D56C21
MTEKFMWHGIRKDVQEWAKNCVPCQTKDTRYLLTVIDRSTRWLEAAPMVEASASACLEALLSSWISRFGVPDDITTYTGPAFLSELWVSLARLMRTTLHSTTVYNPAANAALGPAGSAHCTKGKRQESPTEKSTVKHWPYLENASPQKLDDPDTPLPRLREIAKKFEPCRKTLEDRTHNFNPEGLKTCTHVFRGTTPTAHP